MAHAMAVELLNYNFKALFIAISKPNMSVESALRRVGLDIAATFTNDDRAERDAMILRLHKEGYSRRKIGDIMGMPPTSVYHVIRTNRKRRI